MNKEHLNENSKEFKVAKELENALNDYGISENPLSKFVWAQTNTEGDETDDDDGNNTSGFIVCHCASVFCVFGISVSFFF